MPITITVPPEVGSPHPLGPGITALWEFVGPIPSGWSWDVQITDSADETVVGWQVRFNASSSSDGVVIGAPSAHLLNQPQDYRLTHGTPALLTVRLLDELLVQREIGNRAITYDTVTGVPYLQTLITSSPITGGFTETDRGVLNSTNASVLSVLPLTVPLGGSISVGVDQLLKGPPIDFLAEGEQLLISGRGSLTRASGSTGVYAYGGRWNIESAPAGLGKLDGQAVIYEQRISQFVVVKNRLGGGLYAFQIEDSHYDSGELQWPIPFPVRIDYDILPGVTVRWRWLLLLQ